MSKIVGYAVRLFSCFAFIFVDILPLAFSAERYGAEIELMSIHVDKIFPYIDLTKFCNEVPAIYKHAVSSNEMVKLEAYNYCKSISDAKMFKEFWVRYVESPYNLSGEKVSQEIPLKRILKEAWEVQANLRKNVGELEKWSILLDGGSILEIKHLDEISLNKVLYLESMDNIGDILEIGEYFNNPSLIFRHRNLPPGSPKRRRALFSYHFNSSSSAPINTDVLKYEIFNLERAVDLSLLYLDNPEEAQRQGRDKYFYLSDVYQGAPHEIHVKWKPNLNERGVYVVKEWNTWWIESRGAMLETPEDQVELYEEQSKNAQPIEEFLPQRLRSLVVKLRRLKVNLREEKFHDLLSYFSSRPLFFISTEFSSFFSDQLSGSSKYIFEFTLGKLFYHIIHQSADLVISDIEEVGKFSLSDRELFLYYYGQYVATRREFALLGELVKEQKNRLSPNGLEVLEQVREIERSKENQPEDVAEEILNKNFLRMQNLSLPISGRLGIFSQKIYLLFVELKGKVSEEKISGMIDLIWEALNDPEIKFYEIEKNLIVFEKMLELDKSYRMGNAMSGKMIEAGFTMSDPMLDKFKDFILTLNSKNKNDRIFLGRLWTTLWSGVNRSRFIYWALSRGYLNLIFFYKNYGQFLSENESNAVDLSALLARAITEGNESDALYLVSTLMNFNEQKTLENKIFFEPTHLLNAGEFMMFMKKALEGGELGRKILSWLRESIDHESRSNQWRDIFGPDFFSFLLSDELSNYENFALFFLNNEFSLELIEQIASIIYGDSIPEGIEEKIQSFKNRYQEMFKEKMSRLSCSEDLRPFKI